MADGLLRVSRKSPKDIRIRDLYLLLDEEKIGNLEYGSSIEKVVSAGEHTLTATNRLYTKTLSFSVAEGGKAEFEAINRPSGCGGLLFVVVGMGPYKIELTNTSSPNRT